MSTFRMLGPMELRVGGTPVDLGPPKQRLVLAALLVDSGRPVPMATLVDRVWDQSPPAEARNALYVHIARIRRILARAADLEGDPPTLRRWADGYLLDVDLDQVDLHRFRRLVRQAADHPDDERVLLLREALELGRGPLMAGVPGTWAERVRAAHDRQRLTTVMAWAEAELRLGNHEPLLAQLPDLVDEHPLVEPLTAILMRALHATGRGAEALAHYATCRQRLVEELGTDPGAELRDLHAAILRGTVSPASAGAPATSPPQSPPHRVPAQLPPDLPGFSGRDRDLEQLDALLSGRGRPGAPLVCAISGSAGIGKSALAVHWAYRHRGHFPDGQLYVNLRGFSPDGSVLSPTEAIRNFLDALGVPPRQIPTSSQGQLGLYRSILADRQVLVVLDNARDADQIRPLLPGSPSCLILTTSRNKLTGLVATEGAHPLTLDLLTPAEARQLLTMRLGQPRTAAEPAAVDRIIDECSGLPLALAVVAARAATHPGFGLTTFADELHDAHGKLDALAADDLTANVRAVFRWSYRILSPLAARMFRLLGLHPGPDIDALAAASLTGSPVGETHPLLVELCLAGLISERLPGRFALHDLLRVYATELVQAEEPGAGRLEAQHRMLDHYLHTAYAANRLLDPHRHPITIDPARPGVTGRGEFDREQAMAWFAAEHAVLVAIVNQAARTGFDRHTWQLTWALTDFSEWRGHWHDWKAMLRTALVAAERIGDLTGQAHIRRSLASAHMRLGHHDEALVQLRRALELAQEFGDPTEEAYTHRSLARLFGLLDRYPDALGHARQALQLYRSTGHRAGEARALNNVGWDYAQLGDHQQALVHCRQALALLEDLGDRYGQANTWDSIGYTHHQLREYEPAEVSFRRAIELYRSVGDRYNEAESLTNLGDTHRAAGSPADARTAWRRALDILEELAHPDADLVRARLERLGPVEPRSPGRPVRRAGDVKPDDR